MSDNTLATQDMGTDPAEDTANQAQAVKTFTQEEVNAILARTKSQLEKKFQSKYEDLGDPDELRSLKQEHERRKTEESVKRGEFEKVLQDLAAKKDAEIQRRDQIIREYRVDTPLVNAAARFRAVAPEQVKALLKNQVRLNAQGEVEVTDDSGQVAYNDKGQPLGVDDLVQEFLNKNPHFVQPTPATTNSRSNISSAGNGKLDISKLDMKNAADRQLYKEWMAQQKI